MPCSGDRGPFVLRSASSARAVSSAFGLTVITACSDGPCRSKASIRARHIRTSVSAVSVPAVKAALRSAMVAASRSIVLRADTGASIAVERTAITIRRAEVVMRRTLTCWTPPNRAAMIRRMASIRSRHAVAIAIVAFVFAASAPAAAQKRGITERDLFKFVWVADPQISPDGRHVAFVRVTVDEKNDQYEARLWIAPIDRREPPRQLTGGTRDTAPRWAPDGSRLAFVRVADRDNRVQPPQIYVLSTQGGEARAITDHPRGAGNPQWSPDGRTIAFASTAKPEDIKSAPKPGASENKEKEKEKETEKNKDEKAPRVSDVRVVTEPVYRANGVADFGYVDTDRPSHIWTVAVPAGDAPLATPKPITSGDFSEGNFKWSPDGSRIFFVSNRVKEPYYFPDDSDLYSAPAGGGELTKVASIDGTISDYAFSPDGKRVAFVGTLHGSPVRSYSQSDLWVAALPSQDGPASAPRNLTPSYDFDIDGGLGGDQRAPRGAMPGGPIWTRDGRTIVVKVGEQGDANIKRVDVASGKVAALTRGHHDVMAYTADGSGQRLAVIVSSQTVLGDIRTLDATTGTMAPLTNFNDDLFNQLTLSEPEEIWYRQLRRQEDPGLDPQAG